MEIKGILSCNVNPWLPSLSDAGFTWSDVVSAIDAHRMFYCKAYRKRTVYLSPEVYYLLRRLRPQKPLYGAAEMIYNILADLGPASIQKLKPYAVMDRSGFDKAFAFLLEQMYITAWSGGKVLNPNWSAFEYTTAQTWESAAKPCNASLTDNPKVRLQELLLPTMPEKELNILINK